MAAHKRVTIDISLSSFLSKAVGRLSSLDASLMSFEPEALALTPEVGKPKAIARITRQKVGFAAMSCMIHMTRRPN